MENEGKITDKLTKEDKKNIIEFMIPYAQQKKINMRYIEDMLDIIEKAEEKKELGFPEELSYEENYNDPDLTTFKEKERIIDFMVPYARQDKIRMIKIERMLGIENDPYERVELGLPAKLITREELHEAMLKGLRDEE